MSTLRRSNTAPELALRRELHALGLRYRVQYPVPGNRRRRIDVAFTSKQLAVFVDGCFWHGCSEHQNRPATNSDWWAWKFETIRARDADTNRLLIESGWRVIRVWEHEDPSNAARRIAKALATSTVGA
jgi:DNA mismatch endonuclease (patch repair protein)